MRSRARRLLIAVSATAIAAGAGTFALGGVASGQALALSGAPVSVSPPVVKGKPLDGKRLKITAGSWSGARPISYSYAWERCNAAGGECHAIEGATGSSYTATSRDVGSTLRATVKATNGEGSAGETSAPSSKIGPAPPHKHGAPTISGTVQDGHLLSAEPGTWKGTPPFSFAYQWLSCKSGSCAPIAGAQSQTYRVASEQLGAKLQVKVTATNQGGSGIANSRKTAVVAPGPPVNVAPPKVAGLALVGQKLTAEVGTWAGTGPFTYSYVWSACNPVLGCAVIAGANEPTYTVQPLQALDTIEVEVKATNSLGSASASSAPSGLIPALLPENLQLPSITGLLEDGGVLSVLNGAWGGTEPLGFAYKWLLCDAGGGECHEVEGALGSTFALVSSMIGDTVRVVVTATNPAGSTSATSEPTSLIGALLPSNTKLPSITGLLEDGATLTGLLGSWTGSEASFKEVWELCDAAGEGCKAIQGALGTTLGLLTSEIGSTVRLAVTATNSAGSTTAYSEPTSPVLALLPSASKLPSITGLLEDGGTLTGLLGSWSGSEPLSFERQWELCNGKGESCKAIEGAVGSTLGLVTSMIGDTVRLAVKASNSGGSTTAYSEPTSAILALLPSNTKLPSIAGELVDTKTLTAALGSWSGSEPLSFEKQWELCNGKGESCKAIEGAAGTTLGLVTSMIGDTVRLAVKASNARGSSTAYSTPTSAIGALLPSIGTLPSITGEAEDGKTLTGALGSWKGSEPISFEKQWELCNGKGESCKAIEGAIGTTLGLLTGEIGDTVRLAVKASNAAGSTTAYSSPTSSILAILPSIGTLPSITGEAEDGKTLTGALGSWKGSEPISFEKQWELCNGKGESCKAIEGAIGTTLGLLTSEIGDTVRLAVKGTNSRGSATAYSAPTSAILAILPLNTLKPSIKGTLQIGQTLEALTGTWTGSAPISYTFQWQTCGLGKESECTNIGGAIEKILKLELGFLLGVTVRVVVTATNARGSAQQASPISVKILGLALTPNAGATSGGTEVLLTGPEASKVTAVKFGARKASKVEVLSPTEVSAVSPPGSEGTVPVTVSTPEGTTHETPETQFTYEG